MKARTLILTAGAAFALTAPAANAGGHKNTLPQAKLQVAPVAGAQQPAGKSCANTPKITPQVRKAVTAAQQPAAPGTGIPILATTTDDYDNPLIVGTLPGVMPSTAGSTLGVLQSPELIDGYLR